jgi:Gpi18-like mannosyltransferase
MKLIKDLFNKKNALSEILSIFILSRLLIAFIGSLSSLIIIKGKWFSEPSSILDLFFKWDSGWYMSIVQNGYSYIPGGESNVGFFPLYPMLVKIFSLVFGNPVLMGFIISNVALLFAAIYLYKLIMLDFEDANIATKTVFYMLISPLSFFFSIFYTEGLFLFLAIASFYYARKRQWLIASILGYFLSLTRSIGVFIVIPFLIEYFDIDFKSFKIDFKKTKKDILYLFLVPAGLSTYLFYLSITFDNAFAYFHAQSAGWHKSFTSILTTLNDIRYHALFDNILFMGSAIAALVLIIYLIYSRVRISYIVYSLLGLFLYLSMGTLEGITRYVSILFPIYLSASLLSNKSKFLDYLFRLSSIMLLALFTILFVNGYRLVF